MADTPGRGGQTARSALSEDQLRQLEQIELREWLESLDYVRESGGADRVLDILQRLQDHAAQDGIEVPFRATTP